MTPLKPQHSKSPLTATTGLLFHPGQVVTTPGALAAMHQHQCLPLDLLQRHLSGDWGDVPPDDAALNVAALRYGNRIFSSYRIAPGTTIWIITEACEAAIDANSSAVAVTGARCQRAYTTFLKPDEY